MTDRLAEAREYLASLRAQGHRDAEIARALRKAGWTRAETRELLHPAPPNSLESGTAEVRLSPPAVAEFSRWRGCLLGLSLFVVAALVLYSIAARPPRVASSSVCLSNVKQLLLGSLMYASDNDEHFPPAPDWPERIYPYVKNALIYDCPNDKSPRHYSETIRQLSYTMNMGANQLSTKAISRPVELGVLFDGAQVCGGSEAAAFRHNEGANVGFADGHAKWLSQTQFAQVPLQYPTTGGVVAEATPNLPSVGALPTEGNDDPTERYDMVTGMYKARPRYPSSSSDQIRASVGIESPDSAYFDERFTATAHGSYTLSEDLRRLIRSGKAQLKESYEWEGTIVIEGQPQPRTQTVSCRLLARDSFGSGDERDLVPGLWVAYVVAVRMPDGAYQWARAENHVVPQGWRFGIRPVSPNWAKREDTSDHSPVYGSQIRTPVRFEAKGFRDPGDVITSGLKWEWNFDDGTTATGNPVSHTFKQCGDYDVYIRATYQGRVAEYVTTVLINSNDEDDRIVGREHDPQMARDRHKAIDLNNGYSPPRK
ncbi:MAG TPA: PKD domain-containing protein [Armatimonadota bacterium]|jgi:prepilin-type processing-associated H-X9-DG protein